MVTHWHAWIALYLLMGMLTACEVFADKPAPLLLDRLWAITISISCTILVFHGLMRMLKSREDRAYQKWLEMP